MALLTPNSVKYLILHCTNTPPYQDLTTEDVARLHRTQGCLFIKHHFVIQRNGGVGRGRPVNQIGLHANKQFNSCSLGILLVGGKSLKGGKPEDNYTEVQKEALAVVIKDLQAAFPQAKTVGWNELTQSPYETCPNFNVQEWLAQNL